MQTYTHVLLGAVVGQMLFPYQPIAEVSCILASAIPDLTMVPQYMLDIHQKRQPMTKQSAQLMIAKEIGHSLPLWVMICLIGMVFGLTILIAFSVGGVLHVLVDILTHGAGTGKNRLYWETDAKFMWPMPYDLRPFGIWEYRIGHGVLKPKLPEFIVDVLCIITIFAF